MENFLKYDSIPKFITESSEAYYKYLKDNEKGVDKIKITKITRESDYTFILYFESKIPNYDFVTEIHLDGKIIKSEFIQFKDTMEYHAAIYVSEKYTDDFINCKNASVVVDFTHLVWQIRERFVNIRNINLPEFKNKVKFNKDYFPNVSFTDIQLDAINNIFENPVSYVWGAAGSGKTRYVLAYSIINYILEGKKVILTAPTNMALENALSEIIPIAKKYGIEQENIMRNGVPSLKFAKSFPITCRHYDVEKQISKLSTVKKELNKYIKMYNELQIYIEIANEVKNIESETFQIEKLKSTEKNFSLQRNLLQADLNAKTQIMYDCNETVELIRKKQKSILFKISKKIAGEKYSDKALNDSLTALSSANEFVQNLKTQISDYENKIDKNNENIEVLKRTVSSRKEKIQKLLIPKVNAKMDDLNYNKLSVQIEERKSEFNRLTISLREKYSEYTFENIQELENASLSLSTKIDNLIFDIKTKTGNERIKIMLYGCTLDGLARIMPSNFDHVFLDEACYSNIAKTSLLYLLKCPITFLGDHMQLPPVSEINDSELKKVDNNIMFLWSQSGIYSTDLFNFDFQKMYDNYINNMDELPKNLSISGLNQTHRFGSKLAKVLDRHIYKNGFSSALSTDSEILILDVPKKTPNVNNRNANNRENVDEAQAINKYLKENEIENCAVLTPYTNQVRLLKKIVNNISSENIYTIHKSQGQEWDTVIISVSDTDNMYFTNTNNKHSRGKQLMNTAISRAKKTLVIACDVSYWKSLDNQLITELINIGKIIE